MERSRRPKPRIVEEALEQMGFWYPPDAIQAIRDGRTDYHPYDGAPTYPVNPGMRSLILRAIKLAEQPELTVL